MQIEGGQGSNKQAINLNQYIVVKPSFASRKRLIKPLILTYLTEADSKQLPLHCR